MATYAFTNLSNDSETFTTGTDTITLNGTGTTDFFNLLDANDSLSVTGAGAYTNVTVLGGLGNDFVSGLGTGALVYGNQGDDAIDFGSGGGGTVYGGQGQDVVTATGGAGYLIYGNFGNDVITLSTTDGDTPTGAGSSTVYGGNGTDIITGSLGTDLLNGGQDNDTIMTFAGNDRSTLIGGTGNDLIQSGGTAALVYGNQGDDIVTATGSNTTVFGGQGSDEITVGVATPTLTLPGNQGSDESTGQLATSTFLQAFDEEDAPSTGDVITNSVVYGNMGDDSISLMNANSSVAYGGQGSDTVTVAGNSVGADSAADSTTTGAADVVYGNIGDDVVNLGDNQGTVYGGQGNDTIISSNAYSRETGGLGNDTFIADGAVVAMGNGMTAGASAGGPSALTITDFVSGSDKIALSGTVATASNFSSATVDGGLSQAIQAGQNSGTTYTFVRGSTDGYLFYNAGNGASLTGVVLSHDNGPNALMPTDITASSVMTSNNSPTDGPIEMDGSDGLPTMKAK